MVDVNPATERKHPQGRPRAIPEWAFVTVSRLRLAGLGYRRIATVLDRDYGVSANYAAVERLVKGRPPYHEV